MSPELLNPGKFGLEESYPTKESDCYALGMVIYEVLSGLVPFASFKEDTVMSKVLDGECPRRPHGNEGRLFTDRTWGLLELCWKPQPRGRISAKHVLLVLERNSPPLRTPPNADGGIETGHDRLDTTTRDSGMFSPFHRRLVFDHPRTVIEPLTARGNDGLPTPPHGSLPGVTNPMVNQDGDRLPFPPQTGNPKEGWVTRSVRKIFKATKKLSGF
jgi:hypothetical protein